MEFKRELAEQSFELGASVALIARQNAVNANLLFRWRHQYLDGAFGLPTVQAAVPVTESQPPALLPVSIVEDAPATTPTTCPSATWVGACGALVAPLVDALRRHVLAGVKAHADDTPVSVLAPGNGQTKTARLWAYVRDDRNSGSADPPAVWSAYTPNRQGLHPESHLAGLRGVLQADAYVQTEVVCFIAHVCCTAGGEDLIGSVNLAFRPMTVKLHQAGGGTIL